MFQVLLDICYVVFELCCWLYVFIDFNDWLNEYLGMVVMCEQGIVVNDVVNEQVVVWMKVFVVFDFEVVVLLLCGKLLYGVIDDENQLLGLCDIFDNEFWVVLVW